MLWTLFPKFVRLTGKLTNSHPGVPTGKNSSAVIHGQTQGSPEFEWLSVVGKALSLPRNFLKK
jgi:hypothetical protein